MRKFWFSSIFIVFPAFFFGNLLAQGIQIDSRYAKTIDSTYTVLKNGLDHAKKISNEKSIVKNHIYFGDFYTDLGIYNEAIYHYTEAFIFLSNKTGETAVKIQNKLGKTHLSLEQYNLGTSHLKKSLDISKKINYKEGKAYAYGFLGTAHEKLANYDTALVYQQKSLKFFKALDDIKGLTLTYDNIGSIYEDLEKYDSAYIYFQKAYRFSKNISKSLTINVLNNLGDVNRKTGNIDAAFSFSMRAKELALSTNNRDELESAFDDIAETYLLKKDYKNAFFFMAQAKAIGEEGFYSKSMDYITSLQMVYGIKERQAEIELLSKQNQIKAANQNLLLLGIGIILLVGCGFLLYSKKKKKQEMETQRYKQRFLQSELDKKEIKEKSLNRELELKISSLSNYSLNLASKNKMLSDVSQSLSNIAQLKGYDVGPKLNSLAKEIDASLSMEQEWTKFMHYFEQIHPCFFENLSNSASAKLSSSETRLAMLLRLNLSSKEIAAILRITSDSIRIARYRLRKKLPLEKGGNLSNFLRQV